MSDRDQRHEEMTRLAHESHVAIDQVLDVLVPLIQSRSEYTIACRAGCNACCTQHVRLTWPEALLLGTWLRRPEQDSLLRGFEVDYPAWRTAVGAQADAIDGFLARHHGAPPPNHPEAAAYNEAGLEHHRQRRQCPFNDAAGSCTIYPLRPLPCRAVIVVDSADFCGPDAARGPAVVKHPALQNQIVEQLAALRAASETDQPFERALPTQLTAALAALADGVA